MLACSCRMPARSHLLPGKHFACAAMLHRCCPRATHQTHDERVLQRWAAQQAEWQQQAALLAAATGRDATDVTLACGERADYSQRVRPGF